MTALHIRHFPGDAARPGIALHCMMGTGSYWGPIGRLMEGRLDLRAPDMLSHGRSPKWAPSELDYHTQMTRGVAAMIDRPLDLIGHSLGATLALRIAVGAPEAIRSLTLIEPVLFAACPDPEQSALFERMGTALANGDRIAATADFLQIWGLKDDKGAAPPLDSFVQQIEIVAETNDALVHDRFNMLREGGLEAIDAPVMIIRGGDSPAVIEGIANALADRLPDVGVATVPDAGHMLPITHPRQVAELIAINLDRA